MTDPRPSRDRVIRTLSRQAQEILRALDVHLDEQLPGLDLDALAIPPEDVSKLLQAIGGMAPSAPPPDLAGLTGVTDGEIDLDELEDRQEESS